MYGHGDEGDQMSKHEPEDFTLTELELTKLHLAETRLQNAQMQLEIVQRAGKEAAQQLQGMRQELTAKYTDGGKYELMATEQGQTLNPETGAGKRRLARPDLSTDAAS